MKLDRLPRWALPLALVLTLAGALAWGTAAHGTTPPILTRDCPDPHNTATAVVHLEIGGLTSNYLTSIVTVNGVLFGWIPNGGETIHLSHGMNATTTHFVVQIGTYDDDGTPHYEDGMFHERVEIDLPIPPECAPTPTTAASSTTPPTTAPDTSVFVCTDGSVDCQATTSTSPPSTSGAGATTSSAAGGPPHTLPPTGPNDDALHALTLLGLLGLTLGTPAVAAVALVRRRTR